MSEVQNQNKKTAVKNGHALKKNKQDSPFMKLVVTVTGFVFVVYCLCSIVITQAEISEKKQELNALIEEAEMLEEANEEYQSILSEEDERAFMERYAVESLGYAYPNERRFYDTTGN
mgnify:CR=1 FL=1